MAVKKVGILYKADVEVNPLDIIPEHEDAIRKTVPHATVIRAHEEAELLGVASELDALLTWGMYRPAKLAAAATKLKWIHVLSAGFDGIIGLPEIKNKRMHVTSTKGIHGLPIAEHTLCMMLMFTRGFHLLRDRQHQKDWRRHLDADELTGKTVAILGVGEIGRVMAEKFKLNGMKVLGLDVRPVQDKSLDAFYPVEDLLKVLPQADYVCVVVPLTPDTRGWIGEKQLRAMKKSAFLFNVARGPIVDAKALVRALQEGWIAGAGLDALDPEPLPQSSELWSLPNVILSPHMAAISPYYMHRAVKVFCENLRRFDKGEPLMFEFDWDKGY